MDENSPILNGISLWLLCLFYFLPSSNGYGTGAGLRACTDLRPGHGSPNTGPSPYTIQVLNGVTTYTPGTPVAGIHHHESLTNWTLSFSITSCLSLIFQLYVLSCLYFLKKAMEKHVYLTNISILLTDVCETNNALDYKL